MSEIDNTPGPQQLTSINCSGYRPVFVVDNIDVYVYGYTEIYNYVTTGTFSPIWFPSGTIIIKVISNSNCAYYLTAEGKCYCGCLYEQSIDPGAVRIKALSPYCVKDMFCLGTAILFSYTSPRGHGLCIQKLANSRNYYRTPAICEIPSTGDRLVTSAVQIEKQIYLTTDDGLVFRSSDLDEQPITLTEIPFFVEHRVKIPSSRHKVGSALSVLHSDQ